MALPWGIYHVPRAMDTPTAFRLERAALLAGAPRRLFDWPTAARLIAEHRPTVVRAGLGGDWEYTGRVIYRASFGPVPAPRGLAALASRALVPEIALDQQAPVPCWVWEPEAVAAGWWRDGQTEADWPPAARAGLE